MTIKQLGGGWAGDDEHPLWLRTRQRSFVVHDYAFLTGDDVELWVALTSVLFKAHSEGEAWALVAGDSRDGVIESLALLRDCDEPFYVPAFDSPGNEMAEVELAVRVTPATVRRLAEEWLLHMTARFAGIGWWTKGPSREEVLALEDDPHTRVNPETLQSVLQMKQAGRVTNFYTADAGVAAEVDKVIARYCEERGLPPKPRREPGPA